MRKKFLSIALALCMAVSLLPTAALAAGTAWDGTADTSWYNDTETGFTLSTAEQLAGLAVLVNNGTDDFFNKTISLGADIVLNNGLSEISRQWTPIGTSGSTGFAGTFDGCGHTVSGLYINNSANGQALFGNISARDSSHGAVLRNLGVVDSTVTCASQGGGIVGYADGGLVANCYADVTVNTSGNYAGGIVGSATSTITVENCYNVGTVTAGGNYAGGIAPYPTIGPVLQCYGLDSAVPGAGGDHGSYSNSRGYLIGWTMGATVTGDHFSAASGNLSGGGTLVNKLNTWVEDQGSSFYYTWQIVGGVNDGYPVQNAPLSVEQYTVTVTAKKDGETWDSGKTFTLKNNATARVITNLNAVKPGTYLVLDGGADTGATVTVTDANTSVEVNYYTVSGKVSDYDGGGTNSVTGLTVNLYAAVDTAFVTPIATATTGDGGNYSLVWSQGSYVARVAGVSGSYGAGTAGVTVANAPVSNANITLTKIVSQTIAVTSTNHKIVYQVGDSLDVTNLKIAVTMTDGTTQTVDVTTGMVSGFNSSAAVASQTLTVTYDGKITTYTISVNTAAYAGTQAGAPTAAARTENSITLTAQNIGETVEYAKASSSAVPDSGWQTDTNFTGLSSGTYYYFFARVKETTSHAAGAAASAQIRTNQGEFPDTLNIGSGGITVNNGTNSGIQVIYGGSTYDDLPAATQIVITGTSGTYTITVNTSCNITLSGVTITPAANSSENAMNITAETVTLTLADGTINSLEPQRETVTSANSNQGKAALRVASGAGLIINGSTGTLTAAGGNGYAEWEKFSHGGGAAGIGGNGSLGNHVNGDASGSVTVNGGVIIATGGSSSSYWGGGGAGIGGGAGAYGATGGKSGTVTVNGGIVTATGGAVAMSGRSGPGIGGGGGGGVDTQDGPMASGTSGMVSITGGTVIATGGTKGTQTLTKSNSGIGTDADTGSILTIKGGCVKAVSGGDGIAAIGGTTPTNGTANVYKTTFAVPSVSSSGTKVTELTASGYGMNDTYTVDTNKLYFYMPLGSATASYGGNSYAATVVEAGTAEFSILNTFTATASMSGYTYGGTVSTPSVSQNPGSGTVTYYYTTENKNSGGTEWKSISNTTLSAGDYYLYAVIAPSGSYAACTTDAVKFTVSKAAQTTPAAPTVSGTNTSGSITVTSVSGQMYFCQLPGSAAPTSEAPGWTKATGATLTFSSLSPNQSYYIYTYIPEDTNHNISGISAKLNTTTASAKVTAVAAPGNVTLTKYYTTGSSAIPELPGAAKATLEGGGTQYLNITWTAPGTYNTAPSAENTYTWSVSAPTNYTFADGVTHSGSITVTNKAATSVTITVTSDADKLTRAYAGSTIDVTNLFSIDTNAGAASYSMTPGTGTGSITTAGVLTVTKAGTFTVEVDTAAKGNYAAGSKTASLTVNKGTGTGSVTLDNWTYKDTAKTPIPKSDTNGITAVTYSYAGISPTTYAANEAAPTAAGSYKVTTTFATTDLYKECTATATFTIAPQPVTKPTADTTVFTYSGSEQSYTLPTDNRYAITGDTRTNAGSQTVAAALKDKSNYVWQGGGTDDLTFTFAIAPQPVTKPTADTTVFTYSGSEQSYTLTTDNRYAITGDTRTNAGSQTVTAALKDKSNYVWQGGGTDDLTFTFVIAKAPISFTVTHNSYIYDATAHKATVAQTASQTPVIATGKYAVTYKLPADGSGTEDKTDVGGYDVVVTLSDDNFCFAGESDAATHSHKVGELAIQQNAVTALWKNTTTVYDGTAQSPVLELVGRKAADTGVTARLTESKTKADTYAVTAELTGTNSGNYTLTNPNGTFIIQKAPVSFTLSGNSVKKGESVNVIATPSVNGVAAALTYWQSGKQVAAPTETGSYDVYAEIANQNYRHAGGTDGSAQKIGVLTIYEGSIPAAYTVTFDANGGTGSTASMDAVQAGTVRVLPDNGFANVGKTFAGWQYGGKTYQPGESFTQPTTNVTLKALWNDKVYSIGGIIVQEGNPVSNAANVVVTLMLGSRQLAQTVTDADGKYSFANVVPGVYNLVANKNGVTQTVMVTIEDKAVTDQTITMPSSKLNSVVEVKAGSPAIVVGDLEKAFTQQDKTDAASKTVELRLTAQAKAADSANNAQQEIEKKAGSVDLFLELTLTKTIEGTPPTTLYSSPVLLTVVITLPAELQGKDSYTVYRYHGTEVQALTTTANKDNERIEVSKDKTTLTVYTKNFSAYAIQGVTYSGGSVSNCTLTFAVNGGSAITALSKTSGATVDLSAYTPVREGYTFAGWYSDAKLTKAITSVKLTANTTVYAKWTEKGKMPFTDVASDSYYYDAVLWAVDKGITSGTTPTTFNPNGICTRAQAVTFLWRAMGSPEPTAASCLFTDVTKDAYYYKAVLWATEKGITAGTSQTSFSPSATVTRGQTVTFLWRTADTPTVTTANLFGDVNDEAYYANAVLWAVSGGITSGTGAATFSPADGCTRAQIVTFLYRYLSK